MTARTDRSDPIRYSPAYATGAKRMKLKRNTSVELFRCILMFLIVFGHSWGEGIFVPWRGGASEIDWWVFLLIGMLIWHVDGFISISGWYGIRFSWKKFFHLLGTVAFYTILSGVVEVGLGQSLSWKMLKMRSGWFGGAYLSLMLASPLINASVELLAAKSRRQLLCAWLLLAVAFFFTWAPEQFFTGINALGYGHQTFTMMAFVYLTARVARCVFKDPVSRNVLFGIIGAYVLILVVGFIALDATGNWPISFVWKIWSRATMNSSPLMQFIAVVFLMIFVWHIRIPGWLGRVVVYLSPSMFGVYLFHCQFVLPVEIWLNNHFVLHPFIVMSLVSTGLFSVSVMVDLVRRMIVELWRERADRALSRVDARWSSFCLT